MSYDDCRTVRPHCPHPMVLDECIDSLPRCSPRTATAWRTA